MRFLLLTVIIAVLHSESGPALAGSDDGRVDGVVLDMEAARPIAGAFVTARSLADGRTYSTATSQSGNFSLEHLPDGRYALAAEKPGYVRPPWRPGVPPTVFVVPRPAGAATVRLSLVRGGRLAGRVSNPFGAAAPAARVTLLRCPNVSPCDVDRTAEVSTVASNGEGDYEFSGLRAGRYMLVATARLTAAQGALLGQPSVVELAERHMRGGPPPVSPPAPGTPVAYLATYYPDQIDAARAEVVSLAHGETRRDVNLTVQLGPVAVVRGTILNSVGSPAADAQASIIFEGPAAGGSSPTVVKVTPGGAFETAPLTPGRYRLVAATRGAVREAGDTSIDVAGVDVAGVVVGLRPVARVAGRLIIDAASPMRNLREVQVILRRLDTAVSVSSVDVVRATASSAGAFSLAGVAPGSYSISVAIPPELGLWMKSATFGDADVSDAILTVAEGEARLLEITLTARRAGITGKLVHADGSPAPEYVLVALSADRATWGRASTGIAVARMADDGSFELVGLPAGEYYLGAIGTDDPNDVGAEFFEAIASTGYRVTLGDGETRSIVLSIPAGGNAMRRSL